jgi:hypothetical protein
MSFAVLYIIAQTKDFLVSKVNSTVNLRSGIIFLAGSVAASLVLPVAGAGVGAASNIWYNIVSQST